MAQKLVVKPKIFLRNNAAKPGFKELVVYYNKGKDEYCASYSPEDETGLNAQKLLFEYICHRRLGFREYDLMKVLYNG